MKLKDVKRSVEDLSVNFVFEGDFPGYLEARYVRRKPEYFVCYLSTQSGCNQGCRFCWLTTTGQAATQDAQVWQINQQAEEVLDHFMDCSITCNKQVNPGFAKVVHFSFMARGEALSSKVIQENGHRVLADLGDAARRYGLLPRFMISTIMPKSIESMDLRNIFPVIHPTIYYSIYTLDPKFRDKWMPKAMDPDRALDMLANYQRHTGKVIRLHWAFIEGENDRESDIESIVEAVDKRRLRVDVNLVRYNPFSEKQGKEPPIEKLLSLRNHLANLLPKESEVKIIDRVGKDVAASCGMFQEKFFADDEVDYKDLGG